MARSVALHSQRPKIRLPSTFFHLTNHTAPCLRRSRHSLLPRTPRPKWSAGTALAQLSVGAYRPRFTFLLTGGVQIPLLGGSVFERLCKARRPSVVL